MGNFSRKNTFDPLKHYVSVRLQQGVPIVDADWNEMDDIRRYELRAFLKWFVGDGVPQGNDGFRIQPVAGGGKTIVLESKQHQKWRGSSVEVDVEASGRAAEALGFGRPNHYASSKLGSVPARLTSNRVEPFELKDGWKLVVSTNGRPAETVIFSQDDFDDIRQATAAEVVKAIASSMESLKPSVRVTGDAGNDFLIKGGNDQGPGRCLVDGWDVINEQDIRYKQQPLYENTALAEAWEVPPLGAIDVDATRTDLVYLDVWEREVDSEEDNDHLVNPQIGLETCVRLKREWVVRVAQGLADKDELLNYLGDNKLRKQGHAYYPLAYITWRQDGDAFRQEITDVRLTGLSVISHHDVGQMVKDAYGPGYALDHDGQPNLKVSLREAINALLQGTLPSTPALPLTTGINVNVGLPFALEDSKGHIWVFWMGSEREGEGYNVYFNRHLCGQSGDEWEWQVERRLTTDQNGSGSRPSVVEDNNGDIWVFWEGSEGIYFNRHLQGQPSDKWERENKVETTSNKDRNRWYSTLKDSNGDIWVFWISESYDICFNRHLQGQPSDKWEWEDEKSLASGVFYLSNILALEDTNGDIWMFWFCAGTDEGIHYNRHSQGRPSDQWEGEKQLTYGFTSYTSSAHVHVLETSNGDIWVFWSTKLDVYSGVNVDVYCRRHRQGQDADEWEVETQVTQYSGSDVCDFLFEGSHGDIWVFFRSTINGKAEHWCKRFSRDEWGPAARWTVTELEYPLFSLKDSENDIWLFWNEQRENVWYKRLISAI